MREKWARRIAILTGGLVVVLAVVFAYFQNPPPRKPVAVPIVTQPGTPVVEVKPPAPAASATKTPAPPGDAEAPSSLIKTGQDIYAEQACARCHSIAGRGSDRSPLDDVGARLSEAEIRAWLTPSVEAKGFRARHANVDLTPAQRDALVAYLRSLR